MQEYVDSMSAQGGGDGPESVACALHEALNADWRKEAVRVCVIIADAPPHGMGENGDGFPNGCPCGKDPLETARKMAESKIIIYSVAVEPNLGNYKNARGFFKGISRLTHGRYLGLGQAHLLPDVIIGGSAEELDLKNIEQEIQKEYLQCKTEEPSLATDKLQEKVHRNLATKGVATWHLDVTHQASKVANEDIFTECESLSSAKTKLESAPTVSTSTISSTVDSRSETLPTSTAPTSSLPSFLEGIPSFFTGIFGSSSSSSSSAASNPLYSASRPEGASSPMFRDEAPMEYSRQSARVYKDTVSIDQVAKVMTKNEYY